MKCSFADFSCVQTLSGPHRLSSYAFVIFVIKLAFISSPRYIVESLALQRLGNVTFKFGPVFGVDGLCYAYRNFPNGRFGTRTTVDAENFGKNLVKMGTPRRVECLFAGSGSNLKKKDVLIVCNWKCYANSKSANELIDRFSVFEVPQNVTILTCPSFLHLNSMICKYKSCNSKCIPCSQDVSACEEGFGPLTGEITAEMLKDLGVNWTVIGHSERLEHSPTLLAENRQVINKKIIRAIKNGLNVVLCVGEPISHQRDESGYVISQLEDILENVQVTGDSKLVIAYEPSCSVGTGQPTDPVKVNGVIGDIRSWFESTNLRGSNFIYGGSVNDTNACQYILQDNVDGVMVSRVSHSGNFRKMVERITSAVS